jgi:hypothetical protein
LTPIDSSGLPYLAHMRAEPRPIPCRSLRPAVISARVDQRLGGTEGRIEPICPWSGCPGRRVPWRRPTVAPKEIGSMPSSLHSMLAYCRASRSPTPLAEPSAQAASYSRPPLAPQYWACSPPLKWLFVDARNAPAGDGAAEAGGVGDQVRLAVGGTLLVHGLARDLARVLELHVAVVARRQAPISLITFISTWVPYLGRPWPVTALSASTFLAALVAAMKALGSLICRRRPWCRARRPP